MGVQEKDPLAQLSLPPGFRFYPTDEELMVQYLCRKVAGQSFSLQIIGEVDLYKFDPWVLPSKAFFGEKEWYFFSPRDRKYPNGSRPNRVAGSGYWKATGTDKIITTEGRKVGIKKALVFYVGKAPKGIKTNWIMHEYRLIESSCKKGSSKLDEWVLCRLYKKNSSAQKPISSVSSQEYNTNASSFSSSSHLDDVINSLPEIDDQFFTLPRTNELSTSHRDEKVNLHNLGSGSFDWASLAGLNSVAELVPGGHKSRGMVSYGQNDLYVPQFQHQDQVYDMDKKIRNSVEEEGKQRGLRGQTMDNSGPLAQKFTNPIDPFVFKYPTQSSGFEFRQ